MTFRVGQKVVCIDVDGASELKLNHIYTIKEILSYQKFYWRSQVGPWACINVYEAKPEDGFLGFCSERFRPVVDKKTDISIFTRMLTEKQRDFQTIS